MSSLTKNHIGKVMTVEGLISSDAMGITLPHEHLLVEGWDHRDKNYFNSAYLELERFSAAGGKTIVDLSKIGRKRDPEFIRRLSKKAGLQIILGTGYYKDAWLTSDTKALNVQQMTQSIINEILIGIENTDICAGVIGEIGISRPMTPVEEKVLVASANAHRATGATIILHFEIGAQPSEYLDALDIIKKAGANLNQVVISHLIARPDNFELIKEIIDRGCYIGFDLFGQERWPLARDLINTPPEVLISSLKGFIDQGFIERILVSQNVCHVLHMTVNGGLGYGHILQNVVPRLKTFGITDQEIHTVMVENPKRLLAFQPNRF